MKWLTVRYRASVRSAMCTVTLRWASRWRCSPLPSPLVPPGYWFGVSSHLDEGSIWVRGTLPPSEGPTASIDFTNKARLVIGPFPEVTKVISQTGRPDDGTIPPASSIPNTLSI